MDDNLLHIRFPLQEWDKESKDVLTVLEDGWAYSKGIKVKKYFFKRCYNNDQEIGIWIGWLQPALIPRLEELLVRHDRKMDKIQNTKHLLLERIRSEQGNLESFIIRSKNRIYEFTNRKDESLSYSVYGLEEYKKGRHRFSDNIPPVSKTANRFQELSCYWLCLFSRRNRIDYVLKQSMKRHVLKHVKSDGSFDRFDVFKKIVDIRVNNRRYWFLLEKRHDEYSPEIVEILGHHDDNIELNINPSSNGSLSKDNGLKLF